MLYENVCDFDCNEVTVLLDPTMDLLPTFIIQGSANFQLESENKGARFPSLKFTNPVYSGPGPAG